jgi:preprotein translocase subunit SecB
MAEDKSKDKTKDTAKDVSKNKEATQQVAPDMPINILAQYIRDLSFENPQAPEALKSGLPQPEMELNIGMDARKIPSEELENLYEVVLNLRAAAMRGKDPVFVAELQYGVTVQINDVPEENHHPLLLIEIPRLAFPYAREIMSDISIKGGYPPLMLNPIDFQALYMERYKEEIDASKEEATQN